MKKVGAGHDPPLHGFTEKKNLFRLVDHSVRGQKIIHWINKVIPPVHFIVEMRARATCRCFPNTRRDHRV
jgi:hypothetical protein